MNKLSSIIQTEISLFNDDGWNGYLYRSGGHGIFYHTSAIGASFYGKDVKKYETPLANKVIIIDIDEEIGNKRRIGLKQISKLINKTVDEIIEDDLAIAIEQSLPIIKDKGYDAVVIVGETGAEVYGDPVEVVYWGVMKEIPMSIEDISGTL